MIWTQQNQSTFIYKFQYLFYNFLLKTDAKKELLIQRFVISH